MIRFSKAHAYGNDFLYIDRGDIKGVKVLSGEPTLARSASDAVRQWKYRPYLLNGEPVEIETQITVNFKLPH